MAYVMKDDDHKEVKKSKEVPSQAAGAEDGTVTTKIGDALFDSHPAPEFPELNEAIAAQANSEWENSESFKHAAELVGKDKAKELNNIGPITEGLLEQMQKDMKEDTIRFKSSMTEMEERAKVDHNYLKKQFPLTAGEGTSDQYAKERKVNPAPQDQQVALHNKENPNQLTELFQEGIAKQMHEGGLYNLTKMQQDQILLLCEKAGLAPEQLSDGYHTFAELYEMRMLLTANWFYAIYWTHQQAASLTVPIWRSKKHSDGTMYEGYFIVGYQFKEGHQITFHYKENNWELFHFCRTIDKAPQWDGHTTTDVIKRLRNLVG